MSGLVDPGWVVSDGMAEPSNSRHDIAAALSRYAPVIGVAASVSWSLYTLGDHGLEPLASVLDSPAGAAVLIAVPPILAILCTRWWYQRAHRAAPENGGPSTGGIASASLDASGASRPAVGDTKVCPSCAETVRANAAVCRYCGHAFDSKDGRPRLGSPASLAVLLISLLILGGGAVFVLRDRSLSDGELIWCRSHPGDVAAAADTLRLDPPLPGFSWTDWAVLARQDSPINSWDNLEASAKARRDQACRAAFGGKG